MFLKNISKIMGNNRGYVAIILAVFIPLALSLFYLYISYSSVSSLKTQANIAARDAAIAVASNYGNNAFFDTDDSNKAFQYQKDYLTRKAVLAFNATMKSNLGINKNAIPVTKKNIYYKLDTTNYGKRWVDNTWKSLSEKCFYIYKNSLLTSGYSYDPEFPQYLDGFPGVFTKRWHKGTDRERNTALIQKLQGVPYENRKIKFVTALALSDGEKTVTAVGDVKGYVAEAPRGENGFGFDEIFELEDGRTLAELSADEKNQISARKNALENLKEKLKNDNKIS